MVGHMRRNMPPDTLGYWKLLKIPFFSKLTNAQQFWHNYILNRSVDWNLHYQILAFFGQQVQSKLQIMTY